MEKIMATKINLDKTKLRLAAIITVVAIAALLLGAAIGTFVLAPKPVAAQTVNNLFLDVNGDNLTDYLIYGQVVINHPFLSATPTPQVQP
jgi:hypothetical protein